jgi:hypothetical protein
MKWTIG